MRSARVNQAVHSPLRGDRSTATSHIRPPTYLTASGHVIENPADELVAKDRRHARLRYALRFSWRFWRDVIARDLADHAPINYARALFS